MILDRTLDLRGSSVYPQCYSTPPEQGSEVAPAEEQSGGAPPLEFHWNSECIIHSGSRSYNLLHLHEKVDCRHTGPGATLA